jgi:hypothetical protein
MKIVDEPKKTFTVELTKEEVEFIRGITQNPLTEVDYDYYTRIGLFVGCSRLLGYNMNDDGTINTGY